MIRGRIRQRRSDPTPRPRGRARCVLGRRIRDAAPPRSAVRRCPAVIRQSRSRRWRGVDAVGGGRVRAGGGSSRAGAGWHARADARSRPARLGWLGRSPDAVRLHAQKLGIHRPPPRRRGSDWEDALIRDGYTSPLGCAQIAGQLPHRSAASVAARARKLGLATYARRWSTQDDERLAQLTARGARLENVAQRLGGLPGTGARETSGPRACAAGPGPARPSGEAARRAATRTGRPSFPLAAAPPPRTTRALAGGAPRSPAPGGERRQRLESVRAVRRSAPPGRGRRIAGGAAGLRLCSSASPLLTSSSRHARKAL